MFTFSAHFELWKKIQFLVDYGCVEVFYCLIENFVFCTFKFRIYREELT